MTSAANGLPGFEAVLREHKRLASKLTSDEIRAISEYIEERLRQEQADINFRLYALRNDYDITVRRSSETITDLYQELNEKKEIIKHYQSSDKNIIAAHKQKEERWERKQDLLLNEIQKTEGEAAKAKSRLETLESELEKTTKAVSELETKLEIANKAVAKVEEAELVIQERDEGKVEILKLKMEVDKRDRAVSSNEKMIAVLKADLEQLGKDKKYTDMRTTNIQDELRKQVAEVAEKCKQLTELQFRLQMEERQVTTMQKQLKQATEELRNYKRLLEEERPPLHPKDPIVVTLKKDLDIMDIRIRSLDIAVRLRMDEIKKLEDRVEDTEAEEKLVEQIRKEIYTHGDTFLELTVSELVKKLDFKKRRLQDELSYARDWEQPSRDADMLRSEITALMKQAAICKATELSNRAAKQLQKIDLIMRGTSDSFRMPKIYKVSERGNSDQRSHRSKLSNGHRHPQFPHKPAFITSSTPINSFDSGGGSMTSRSTHKRFNVQTSNVVRVSKSRAGRPPALGNYTDDSKIQYIDTVELDLSRLTPVSSSRRESQSDRMTLKSVSDSTVPAILE
ncbi:protein Hook homolog 1-like [Dreissena polymorpha]|uniref:Uncharacterized protein n=1 Tax=Dreissena polymorpha TaxID=45954 RepID=A0A9D4S1P1_DREPO|nr:protein Hook homolog 1-like [Dreissena polymorpha]XP_052228742.1 protein Hook homolog 1-like [Dreissena polymorpha]KAH3886607.1 hypothetical protein DPMN_010618 [Dreissena polymorpha]